MRRESADKWVASIAFHAGWNSEMYIDLDSTILSLDSRCRHRVIGMLFCSAQKILMRWLPSFMRHNVHLVRHQKVGPGSGQTEVRMQPGVTHYELPAGVDPKLAIPLLGIRGMSNGSVAITVICEGESDVHKIIRAAPFGSTGKC